MSHFKILMVGTEANLMQIYADCYLCPLSKNELLGKDIKKYDLEDYEFTKEDKELYNKIIQGRMFYDCFDIRDNTSNHRITEELSDKGLDNFFNSLPDNTHLFLCDGHL